MMPRLNAVHQPCISLCPHKQHTSSRHDGAQPPTVVVAFGGNALLKRGEPLTMDTQVRICVCVWMCGCVG